MSMEADLYALLKAICPRAYPDVAPTSTLKPYVTYQAFGGQPLRFGDNTPADKRNTRMQINVWSATRMEANTLIHQIEEALCATAAFTATPESEPLSDYDYDMQVYGATQDFSIYAAR